MEKNKSLLTYSASFMFTIITFGVILLMFPQKIWGASIPLLLATVAFAYVMTKWTPQEVLSYWENNLSRLQKIMIKSFLVLYFIAVLVLTILFGH